MEKILQNPSCLVLTIRAVQSREPEEISFSHFWRILLPKLCSKACKDIILNSLEHFLREILEKHTYMGYDRTTQKSNYFAVKKVCGNEVQLLTSFMSTEIPSFLYKSVLLAKNSRLPSVFHFLGNAQTKF